MRNENSANAAMCHDRGTAKKASSAASGQHVPEFMEGYLRAEVKHFHLLKSYLVLPPRNKVCYLFRTLLRGQG